MRALHTADLHLGLTRYGYPGPEGRNSRVGDFIDTLDRFVAAASDFEADVAIFAGDTFHSRREGPGERAAFARAVRALVDEDRTVIVLPGNHDGTTTVADGSTHSLLWLQRLDVDGVHVMLDAGMYHLTTRVGPLDVMAIPYPHKRAFDASLPDLSPHERVLEAGKRLEEAIRTLGVRTARTTPLIAVGHLTVAGALAGSETAMKMGWDVAVSPAAFEGYDYVALGHIHRPQSMAQNVWYPGSPEFIDFSEADHIKGFLDVTITPGQPPLVLQVPSSPRPMVVLDVANADGDWKFSADDIPPGAIVRVIARASAKPDPRTMRNIALLGSAVKAEGASFVKLDVMYPEVQSVRPEVMPDLGIIETTRSYLAGNGTSEGDIGAVIGLARSLVAAEQ